MQIYKRLKGVGLFAVGCTLGSLAVFTFQNGGSLQVVDRVAVELGSEYEGGHEANACTPTSQENDSIFFVSCGGIY